MTPEKMASEAHELVNATIWEGIEMERAVAVLKEVPALAARIKSLEEAARLVMAKVEFCEPGAEFVCGRDSCQAMHALRSLLTRQERKP